MSAYEGLKYYLQIMPMALYFSFLLSLVIYYGYMRKVILYVASVLRRVTGTSSCDTLSVASNIIVAQVRI